MISLFLSKNRLAYGRSTGRDRQEFRPTLITPYGENARKLAFARRRCSRRFAFAFLFAKIVTFLDEPRVILTQPTKLKL